jgi:hypothetical protein
MTAGTDLVPGRQALDVRRESSSCRRPGCPCGNSAFISSALALAEPVPFTLAILMVKSLSLGPFAELLIEPDLRVLASLYRTAVEEWVGVACLRSLADLRAAGADGLIDGMRPLQGELLHVPGRGRAALGAETAVHAQVLVLDHHAPVCGSGPLTYSACVDVFRGRRQRLCAGPPRSPDRRHRQAVRRADVDAGIALDAELRGRTPSGRRSSGSARPRRACSGVKPSSTSMLSFLKRSFSPPAAPVGARPGCSRCCTTTRACPSCELCRFMPSGSRSAGLRPGSTGGRRSQPGAPAPPPR